jgi:hypothetical protein
MIILPPFSCRIRNKSSCNKKLLSVVGVGVGVGVGFGVGTGDGHVLLIQGKPIVTITSDPATG